LVLAGIDQGSLVEREADVRQMAEEFPRIVGWLVAATLVNCELGRLEEARRQLKRAIDAGAVTSKRRNEWFGTMGALAVGARRLSDDALARDVYSLLSAFSGQFAVIGYGSGCWGAVDRFLGLSAAAAGQHEKALEHLQAAVSLNESAGAGPALAHSSWDLACLLEEIGLAGATEAGAEALRLARKFGMRRLEAAIRGCSEDIAGSAG
jgi:tetratricopeptide (TPR) repeat protein